MLVMREVGMRIVVLVLAGVLSIAIASLAWFALHSWPHQTDTIERHGNGTPTIHGSVAAASDPSNSRSFQTAQDRAPDCGQGPVQSRHHKRGLMRIYQSPAPADSDEAIDSGCPTTLSIPCLPTPINPDLAKRYRPFALWFDENQHLWVISENGTVLGSTQQFPQLQLRALPHFVGGGCGALQAGKSIVDAVSQRPAVSARTVAYQRISNRRWNLLLDGNILVELPERRPEEQLDTLQSLIVLKGVLERSISEIDLRDPTRYLILLRDGSEERVLRTPIARLKIAEVQDRTRRKSTKALHR
jgi:Cell division protein FtsQ